MTRLILIPAALVVASSLAVRLISECGWTALIFFGLYAAVSVALALGVVYAFRLGRTLTGGAR